jgi:hypothetical protein
MGAVLSTFLFFGVGAGAIVLIGTFIIVKGVQI